MLIRKTPDQYEKLAILAGMVTYDILSPPGGRCGGGQGRSPCPAAKKSPSPGI